MKAAASGGLLWLWDLGSIEPLQRSAFQAHLGVETFAASKLRWVWVATNGQAVQCPEVFAVGAHVP